MYIEHNEFLLWEISDWLFPVLLCNFTLILFFLICSKKYNLSTWKKNLQKTPLKTYISIPHPAALLFPPTLFRDQYRGEAVWRHISAILSYRAPFQRCDAMRFQHRAETSWNRSPPSIWGTICYPLFATLPKAQFTVSVMFCILLGL